MIDVSARIKKIVVDSGELAKTAAEIGKSIGRAISNAINAIINSPVGGILTPFRIASRWMTKLVGTLASAPKRLWENTFGKVGDWIIAFFTVNKLVQGLTEVFKLQLESGKAITKGMAEMADPIGKTYDMMRLGNQLAADLEGTMDFSSMTEMMSDFVYEGLDPMQDGMADVMKTMGQFAYFNGEAASSLIPLIAGITKTGQQLNNADLQSGLGAINVGFGKFSSQAVSALVKISRITGRNDFGRLALGAAGFSRALMNVGMTAEEATETVTSLLSTDIDQVPAFFQRFAMIEDPAQKMKAMAGGMEDLYEIVKDVNNPVILGEMAKQFGVSTEMLQGLRKGGREFIKNWQDEMLKTTKADGVESQFERARRGVFARFQAFGERMEGIYRRVVVAFAAFLDSPTVKSAIGKLFNAFQRLGTALANAFSGGGDEKNQAATTRITDFFLGVVDKVVAIVDWFNEKLTGKEKGGGILGAIGEGMKWLGEKFKQVFDWTVAQLPGLAQGLLLVGAGILAISVALNSASLTKIAGVGIVFATLAALVLASGSASGLFTVGGGLIAMAGGTALLGKALGVIAANPKIMALLAAIGVSAGGIGMLINAVSGAAGIGDEVAKDASNAAKYAGPMTADKQKMLEVNPEFLGARKAATNQEKLLNDIRGILSTMAVIDKAQLETLMGINQEAVMAGVKRQADRQTGLTK